MDTNDELIKKFKVNNLYIIFYAIVIGINGICVTFTTAGNN